LLKSLSRENQEAKRLAREQRKLSKRVLLAKEKGVSLSEAKNYQKQKLKVARLHEKMTHQREDLIHQLSTGLVTSYDTISLEHSTPGAL